MRWPIVIASSVVAAGVFGLALVTEGPHEELASRRVTTTSAPPGDEADQPIATADDCRVELVNPAPIRSPSIALREPEEAPPSSSLALDSEGTLFTCTVVRDEDGVAIRAAHIQILQEASGCCVSTFCAATLVSDEAGRFLFRSAKQGSIQVSASGRIAIEIPVNRGKEDDLLFNPVVRMVHAATLRGRVLDAARAPAEDVIVELTWLRDPASVGAPRLSTTTDATGAFEIEDVPRSGTFVVTAATESVELGRSLPMHAPPLPFEELAPVTIELPRLGDIVGTITNDDRLPLQGLPLEALSVDGDDGATVRPRIRDCAWSDESGRFEFRRLPLGRYLVRAENAEPVAVDLESSIEPARIELVKPALESEASELVVSGRVLCESTSDRGTEDEPLELDLDTGRFEETVTVESDGSFEFTGLQRGRFELRVANISRERFWFEPLLVEAGTSNLLLRAFVPRSRISARIRCDGPQPCNGSIEFVSASGGRAGADAGWDSEADEGRVTSEWLPPDDYFIDVSDSRHEPARFGPFTLRESGTLDVGELSLHELARVRARVVDAGGRPLADAHITGLLAEQDRPTVLSQEFDAYTDERGEFDLIVLHPRLLLWVVHREAAPTTFFARDFSLVGEVELRLDAGATLSGRVVTTSGAPVPSLPVSLSCRRPDESSDDTWSAYQRDTDTADDGTFRFDHLPLGTCRIRIGSALDDDGVLARRTVEIRDRFQELDPIVIRW